MWSNPLQEKFTLVLIAGFRAGLAGLNLVYPENRALKPSSFINIFYKGLSWVSWVLKKYELGLAGLAGFEKKGGL